MTAQPAATIAASATAATPPAPPTPPTTTRWWRARLDASHDEPRLAAAVLDRRYLRYAIHRLRGFALARGTGAALHVLEASVLLSVLSPRTAVMTFVASHLSTLLGGVWWGATEAQRTAIRAHRDPEAIDRITASWLWWAWRFAALTLLAAGAVAIFVAQRPLTAAYAIVLGLRVASDLPLRVYHSRIAARSRVYRLIWLQIVVEAVGPVMVLVLRGRIHAWGFFIALATSTVLSRVMSWYFIRRAHATSRFALVRPATARRRLPMPWLAMLGLGVAGVATRVPSVLGVVFLATPRLPLNIAIGLHMTVGALSAAGGWAWTHYQDFIALDGTLLTHLRRRLERLVLAEALVVGALVGGAVLAIVYFWAPRSFSIDEPGVTVLIPPKFADPWPYALALPAVAMALSMLAASQVHAWTRRAFAAVIASGAAATVGLICAPALARWIFPARMHHHNLSASSVRGEHLVMGVLLMACALALWLVARRTRDPIVRRVTWPIARRRAIDAPADVFHLVTGPVPVRAIDALEARLLAAGARWWSRRERSWLVAGLSPAQVRGVARACAGMITLLEPFVPPKSSPGDAAEVRAAVRDDVHRFRFVGADVPTHPDLDNFQLAQVFVATLLELNGAMRGADVTISAVELDGDALVGVSARFRRK